MTSKKMTDIIIVMLIILSVAIPAAITFREPLGRILGQEDKPESTPSTTTTLPPTTTTTVPPSQTVIVVPVDAAGVPLNSPTTPSTPQPTTPPTNPTPLIPPPSPTDPPVDEPVTEVTELVDEVVDGSIGCNGVLVILC